MTYGEPIDPFNFRLALRHIKIALYTNSIQTQEYFMTFNNSNQMIWYSDSMKMQVIKFDGNQMMVTFCVMNRGEIYSILLKRYDDSGKSFLSDSIHSNRLILDARNLKTRSKYNLQSNCKNDAVNMTEIANVTNIAKINVKTENVEDIADNGCIQSGVNSVKILIGLVELLIGFTWY